MKFIQKTLPPLLSAVFLLGSVLQTSGCSFIHNQTPQKPRAKYARTNPCTYEPAVIDGIGTMAFLGLSLVAFNQSKDCGEDGGICIDLFQEKAVGTVLLVPALVYAAATIVGTVGAYRCNKKFKKPPKTDLNMDFWRSY